jgi:AcrR family transcriptional regulator
MERRQTSPTQAPSPRRRVRSAEPLTRERILEAAFAIAETDGLAALSTRRLGERLGCEAMSIYHHFAGKHHLLDAMVDQVIASFEWPPAGSDPIDALRQAMHAYRAMAHRWPSMFALVATHRLNTPTGVRFIEGILALVQTAVPDPALAARHFRTLGYYLAGAGIDETSGYAKGPSAAEPVSNEYIAEHCPRLAAASKYFARSEWDATFELGVEALLAAIARDARS